LGNSNGLPVPRVSAVEEEAGLLDVAEGRGQPDRGARRIEVLRHETAVRQRQPAAASAAATSVDARRPWGERTNWRTSSPSTSATRVPGASTAGPVRSRRAR
jgi:hypothetical protein